MIIHIINVSYIFHIIIFFKKNQFWGGLLDFIGLKMICSGFYLKTAWSFKGGRKRFINENVVIWEFINMHERDIKIG